MSSAKNEHEYLEEKPLNEKVENKKVSVPKSFYEKLRYVQSNITVEPILAGLIIPSMLARLAVQNLNLDKACRVKLAYEDLICDALIERKGNLTDYEGKVQAIISGIESWKSIIQTAIPILLVIFMGAWSDRTGNRKICILLPILGELLVCTSNIVSTYFFYDISVEITMFFEAFFSAITGGWVMVFMGVFSYISDITDAESRTFRVGLVNLCMTAGIPIGTALSGILLKVLGYYGVFAISGSIYMMTLVYGYFYLESNTKPDDGGSEKKKTVSCSDMFSLVKETATVAFKKREFNYRKKIILTLTVVAIIYGPSHGKSVRTATDQAIHFQYKLTSHCTEILYCARSAYTGNYSLMCSRERILTYMYVRYRLKWDAIKYSMYSTYSIITHSLGALFSISVFSKRWGFHDSMLCLISVVSKLAGSILVAFVQTDFHMFMVPIVEILNATTYTSLRSMASKLVPSEEMGKMNSLLSLVETLAALVFDPTYSALYARTITVFTGAVFIFSGLLTLPAITILLWFFIKHRQETKERRIQAKIDRRDVICEGVTDKIPE